MIWKCENLIQIIYNNLNFISLFRWITQSTVWDNEIAYDMINNYIQYNI